MKTITMMVAPPALQPGGYIATAYADRAAPQTPRVQLEAERAAGRGYRLRLRWACATPVTKIDHDPSLFPDACALLVPAVEDAPWITMGAPGKPVQAVLWRADRTPPWRLQAEGLGSMRREAPPAAWSATAAWRDGEWDVVFLLPGWPELEAAGRVGIAVWQGAGQERAGLKSVSTDWVVL